MNFINQLHPYRTLLYIIAIIGFFGLNGIFVYSALIHPEIMAGALQNPISLVFIVEAFLIMGFVAWLISKSGLDKPNWRMFIVLSIVGGLAFSVPAFLLLHLRKRHGELQTRD